MAPMASIPTLLLVAILHELYEDWPPVSSRDRLPGLAIVHLYEPPRNLCAERELNLLFGVKGFSDNPKAMRVEGSNRELSTASDFTLGQVWPKPRSAA